MTRSEAGPPREPARPGWRRSPSSGLGLGHRHPARGDLDESARRLGHEELVVAHLLADEGHHVRALRERPGRAPTADLWVCGTTVEVKSWLPLDEREQRIPEARSVYNKLVKASRQAEVVVLNGLGSGITEGTARQGMLLYGQKAPRQRLSTVRVIGDGFDVTWCSGPSLQRGPAAERPDERTISGNGRDRRRAVPDLGL